LDWIFAPATWIIPSVVTGGLILRRIDFHSTSISIQKNYSMALILLQVLILFFFISTNASPFIYFQF
jgi:hypothetical protein